MTGTAARNDRPLYRRTEVLSLEKHGAIGLEPGQGGYHFAADLVSVPATLSEIALAQRHYPVVFAGEPQPIPVIVLGFGAKTGNLMVGDDNQWADGAYVPAFFRRYPFLAVRGPGENQMALAADLDAKVLSEAGSEKLFVEGKPSEMALRAFDFTVKLHEDFERGRKFAAAIAEAGLLTTQRAEVKVPGAQSMELKNFKMIDELKLNDLADETFQDWRRRGWLGAIYAHMMSLAAWADLARRATPRETS